MNDEEKKGLGVFNIFFIERRALFFNFLQNGLIKKIRSLDLSYKKREEIVVNHLFKKNLLEYNYQFVTF